MVTHERVVRGVAILPGERQDGIAWREMHQEKRDEHDPQHGGDDL